MLISLYMDGISIIILFVSSIIVFSGFWWKFYNISFFTAILSILFAYLYFFLPYNGKTISTATDGLSQVFYGILAIVGLLIFAGIGLVFDLITRTLKKQFSANKIVFYIIVILLYGTIFFSAGIALGIFN